MNSASTTTPRATVAEFGWLSVVRLGVVQACLGELIVLITATMNRVMVVELRVPAIVPGARVALHCTMQLRLRPRMGHFADQHGRLTRWIVCGMAILACGVVATAALLPVLRSAPMLGYPLIIVAFVLVGLGVSTAGDRRKPVNAFLVQTARVLIGLPMPRAPKLSRPLVGWIMSRFRPRGLEFARTRVDMEMAEGILTLRRYHLRRMKRMVRAHAWQLTAAYGIRPEPGETQDDLARGEQ